MKHKTYQKYNSTSGFTLIELLLVIAIIGVLSTFSIPRFNNYLASTQVMEALTMISPLQIEVEDFENAGLNFADFNDPQDLCTAMAAGSRYIDNIRLIPTVAPRGGINPKCIAMTFGNSAHHAISGKDIIFDIAPGRPIICRSPNVNGVPEALLPRCCANIAAIGGGAGGGLDDDDSDGDDSDGGDSGGGDSDNGDSGDGDSDGGDSDGGGSGGGDSGNGDEPGDRSASITRALSRTAGNLASAASRFFGYVRSFLPGGSVGANASAVDPSDPGISNGEAAGSAIVPGSVSAADDSAAPAAGAAEARAPVAATSIASTRANTTASLWQRVRRSIRQFFARSNPRAEVRARQSNETGIELATSNITRENTPFATPRSTPAGERSSPSSISVSPAVAAGGSLNSSSIAASVDVFAAAAAGGSSSSSSAAGDAAPTRDPLAEAPSASTAPLTASSAIPIPVAILSNASNTPTVRPENRRPALAPAPAGRSLSIETATGSLADGAAASGGDSNSESMATIDPTTTPRVTNATGDRSHDSAGNPSASASNHVQALTLGPLAAAAASASEASEAEALLTGAPSVSTEDLAAPTRDSLAEAPIVPATDPVAGNVRPANNPLAESLTAIPPVPVAIAANVTDRTNRTANSSALPPAATASDGANSSSTPAHTGVNILTTPIAASTDTSNGNTAGSSSAAIPAASTPAGVAPVAAADRIGELSDGSGVSGLSSNNNVAATPAISSVAAANRVTEMGASASAPAPPSANRATPISGRGAVSAPATPSGHRASARSNDKNHFVGRDPKRLLDLPFNGILADNHPLVGNSNRSSSSVSGRSHNSSETTGPVLRNGNSNPRSVEIDSPTATPVTAAAAGGDGSSSVSMATIDPTITPRVTNATGDRSHNSAGNPSESASNHVQALTRGPLAAATAAGTSTVTGAAASAPISPTRGRNSALTSEQSVAAAGAAPVVHAAGVSFSAPETPRCGADGGLANTGNYSAPATPGGSRAINENRPGNFRPPHNKNMAESLLDIALDPFIRTPNRSRSNSFLPAAAQLALPLLGLLIIP